MAEAGRVIAGTARAVRLEAPGPGTRPLADRVKQTLFAILEPDLPGARVLDLFAGSGAAGIEALSRGAASATFVEQDAGAIRAIEANLAKTGLRGPDVQVIRDDVLRWLQRGAGDGGTNEKRRPDERGPIQAFDIVVVDPPYDRTELLAVALDALGRNTAVVAPGGRVVAKHFWRDAPPAEIGLLASERERRFGDTALTFYRRQEVS